jgi:hypothetical protein
MCGGVYAVNTKKESDSRQWILKTGLRYQSEQMSFDVQGKGNANGNLSKRKE